MTPLQQAQDAIKKAYNLLAGSKVCTCDPEMNHVCNSCQARKILFKALMEIKKGKGDEQKEGV